MLQDGHGPGGVRPTHARGRVDGAPEYRWSGNNKDKIQRSFVALSMTAISGEEDGREG
jgi:hypothetical protein